MSRKLVVVDSRVAGYEQWLAGLDLSVSDVLILDLSLDGVQQIADYIEKSKLTYDALYVISHGSEGTLYLGSATLNQTNIDSYDTLFRQIGTSLTAAGDILLYGCSVAYGSVGQKFIESISILTGADVAASTNVTGSGGDWVLESASGSIESSTMVIKNYVGTLRAIDGTVGADTLTGTVDDDIINGLGGDDSISGDAGHDLIHGGDGNDTIDGGFGDDTIYGDAGNDSLTGGPGSNYQDGGEGDDNLSAQSLTGQQTMLGGLGNDSLSGVGKSLYMDGGDGQDGLCASGAFYANFSTSYVQLGSATLLGGGGDDGLTSYYLASALLQGGDGQDNLFVGGSQNATLDGGVGNDILRGEFYDWDQSQIGVGFGAVYSLNGGDGNDRLEIGGGSYAWRGLHEVFLDGGAGNDILNISDIAFTGTNGALSNGNNGAIESASLFGGEGDDRLNASGVLQLTLSGGTGADTFVLNAEEYRATQASCYFTTGASSSTNVVGKPIEITDFQAGLGGDILDIQDLLRNGTTGYDGSNPFGASGYLRLIQSTSSSADAWLQFDANGGGDNFVTLAILRNVDSTALLEANFSPDYSIDGSEAQGVSINGTPLDDTLSGTYGSDTITGNDGNDLIYGNAGYDCIDAGVGDDAVDGGYGNDTIYGGLGNDGLVDNLGSNYLDGGEGDDNLSAQSLTGQQTMLGGLGNDSLSGVGKSLYIDGGDGQDRLTAYGAFSSGGVTKYVQIGSATLLGGAGDDGITAYYLGNLILQGGEGKDNLSAFGSRSVTLEGGGGDDKLYGQIDNLYLALIGGSSSTDYHFDGGDGDDQIEASSYSSQAGGTNVYMEGGAGNDLLNISVPIFENNNCAIGAARLSGGDGNDRLSASGVLQLTLSGDAGSDTFVLTSLQNAVAQTSLGKPIEITDFQAGLGGDILDIQDLLRDGTSGYDGSNPFGASGYLRLIQSTDSSADAWLQFDANGGGDNFATLAILRNVDSTALVGANFEPGYSINGSELQGISINGTPLDDTLSGTAGSDTIVSDDGNDLINGLGGSDFAFGGGGGDTIDGGFGNDTIYGGQGNDRLEDNLGSNYLDAGEGDDNLSAQSLTGQQTILGGAGNDSLSGVGKSLYMDGGDGQDYLNASGLLVVNGVNSWVSQSSVTLVGGGGDDGYTGYSYWDGSKYVSVDNWWHGLTAYYVTNALLQGGDGRDYLAAIGAQNATLEGGSGNDKLSGGFDLANLAAIGAQYNAEYHFDGGDGDDQLDISSYYFQDVQTHVYMEGGSGNDTLSAVDSSFAYSDGAIVNALLSGGDGDDRLNASGVLQLTLSGGAGADTFALTAQQYRTTLKSYEFNTQAGSITVDGKPIEITDFQVGPGGDVLGIQDLLENGTVNYDGTSPFAGGYFQLVQNGADTLLKFDSNGGGDGYVTLAVLKNVAAATLTSVNLSPAFGTPNNDSLIGGASADRLDGLAGNDTICGGDGNDSATGGVGNDLLSGGTGDDSLNGGGGNDTADYSDSTSNLTVDLSSGTASGGDIGSDSLSSIEEVTGGAGNDSLTGSTTADTLEGGSGNDTLSGGEGSDVLAGGAGSDSLNGGGGNDAVDYSDSTSNLTVDLSSGTASGGDIGSDSLSSIEEVTGGAGNDSLTGSTTADTLEGGSGNDSVVAGGGNDLIIGGHGEGNDTYIGGDGIDTVSYTSALASITVNLSAVSNQAFSTAGGDAANIGTDQLSGIENIIAGSYADSLVGNAVDNAFTGGGGNDTITGGDGVDTAKYSGNRSDYTITTASGITTVVDNRANSPEDTDTLSQVEWLSFADQQVALGKIQMNNPNYLGTAADEWILGTSGNDSVDAGAGNDTVEGAAGNDTLIGGDGNDALMGGAGIDRFNMTVGVDTITDLGNGGADILVVSAGATVNAAATAAWTATSSTSNAGTVNLSTNGFAVNLAAVATGQGLLGWNVANTGVATTLTGSALADSLVGGTGNDTISGGGGNDTLNGADGIDSLAGGTGNDLYVVDLTAAGALQDTLSETSTTSTERDTVRLRGGSTNLTATTITLGANLEDLDASQTGISLLNLAGNSLNNTLTGNDVTNILTGGAGADTLNGGEGNDLYIIAAVADYATNEIIADTGTSTSTADELRLTTTSAGTLTLASSLSGVERIVIGTGTTATANTAGTTAVHINASALTYGITLIGNAGANSLTGGTGNDTLTGNGGADTFTISGTDTITDLGNGGVDVLKVSAGATVNATVSAAWTASSSTVNLGTANLTTGGFAVNLTSAASTTGANGFKVTNSSATATTLTGSALGDTLIGFSGNDTLTGNAGNDSLKGDAGNDRINGGAGGDNLEGGAGSDTFVFAAGNSGQTTNIDTIADYVKGAVGTGDLIDFSSNLTIGGSSATATSTEASINTSTGVATFASSSGTTLSDVLADIATRFTAATNSAGEFALFKVNGAGDYYLFVSDGTAGVTANDVVVQLVGVTTISSITLTSGNLTITS